MLSPSFLLHPTLLVFSDPYATSECPWPCTKHTDHEPSLPKSVSQSRPPIGPHPVHTIRYPCAALVGECEKYESDTASAFADSKTSQYSPSRRHSRYLLHLSQTALSRMVRASANFSCPAGMGAQRLARQSSVLTLR